MPYNQPNTPFQAQGQTPNSGVQGNVPQLSPEQQAFNQQQQQRHEAKMALEQHLHQMRLAQMAAASANEAVDMYHTHGEGALRATLNDMMANGQDPQYLKNVAEQLRLNGRGDLANIHS
jgi:hypothetical protein